jgi:Concanavalin A-like lectin/glucanases superfamily
MRISLAVLGVGTAACLGVAPLNAVAASQDAGVRSAVVVATVTTVADWEMNEPVGATTMTDSSGNGLDGDIIPSDQITTGFVFDGATGYHWVRRAPELFPPVPERVIQVQDDPLLDLTDASEAYTVSLRYRTKEKFGNITQKGQSATRGGQIKFQNPLGRPSCMFKGSVGRVTTRSPQALNDNLWHVLTCTRTSTRVTMFVDGVEVNHQNGSSGVINNSVPWVVGGKISCDQIETTCDYFSGEIDWIRITKGA